MGSMEMKKIDWDKLKKVISERGSTMGKVSVEIGHDRSYLSCCKKNGRKPGIAEKLAICTILKCEIDDITQEEDTQKDGNETRGMYADELKEMHKCILETMSITNNNADNIDEITRAIEDIRETIEAVRTLLSGANGMAVMSGRIKELQELMDAALKASGQDAKAERLIISMIQDGMVEENELMNRAQAEGIGRPDIHRARHRLGMQVITKGYGTNQKKYMALRRA